MLLLFLCPGIIAAPVCPVSYQLSSSPPASSGSAAAPRRYPSRRRVSATAPAPSPFGSGFETRSSPLAVSRLAQPRTPRAALRAVAADRQLCAQAAPPQSSGCRSHTPWCLRLQLCCYETVPDCFPSQRGGFCTPGTVVQ
jgi:hypothetical protein